MTVTGPRHAPEPLELIDAVPERAMIVFAHPDDGELGAGGVVAAWSAQGCEVTMTVCTTGSSGSNDRAMTSAEIVPVRQAEQRAAAAVAGARNVEFLDHPDGGLEADRVFLGEIVRLIRKHRPEVVFCHDPHRINGFNHRDHRMVGVTVLDAVYPYARDHLHFPEQIEEGGLQPYKVREVLMWGADYPDVIIDTTSGIDRQIEALHQHESQVGGLSGGPAVGDRLRDRARAAADGFQFEYGQAYRRLIARS
jgi:LmbE family N-acetylglucosaminyl deacetylase